MAPVVKTPPANAGNVRSEVLVPGLGRSPRVRKWPLTPDFLPAKSRGQRSLVGYSPWVGKESDMTEHACNQL